MKFVNMKVVAAVIVFTFMFSRNSIASCISVSKTSKTSNESYEALVKNVLTDDKNSFKLLQTFYPPNDSPPVFVIIT